MRILHTSDWHIGRTFHGEHVVANLAIALESLRQTAIAESVDVVVIAGDIFDSSMPSADAFDFLDARLQEYAEAGIRCVVTSGNHDSAARLRFQSKWAWNAGIHIFADHGRPARFVEIDDEHGPVRFYGIPYLEPALLRHLPGADAVRTQEDAINWAMTQVRDDLAPGDTDAPSRSVVVAHCFAAGVPTSEVADDLERDLTAGGLDVVPLASFEGADYVALGHIHTRATLAEHIRYSGAPLHYSFKEAGSVRGGWIVDLDASGFAGARWIDVPIPRKLRRLEGTLEGLLTDATLRAVKDDWISATLTDDARPLNAMRKLRQRFPHTVHLSYAPPRASTTTSARERLGNSLSITDRINAFLEYVRGGEGLNANERAVVAEILDVVREQEAAR